IKLKPSQASWIDNYYNPMEARFDDFLKKYDYSKSARKLVENSKEEIKMYRKYKDYFSYGFYIACRIN
ncbi:MAG: SAM-dependent methyltransferase, partial [Halanaerobium sp.]